MGEEVALGFVSLPVREVGGDCFLVFFGVLSGQPVEHITGDEGEADVPASGASAAFILVEPSALAQFGADIGFKLLL